MEVSAPSGESAMPVWEGPCGGGAEGAVCAGEAGEPCLRSAHCAGGLCCARHFWTRICKPVLQEGQVCSRRRQRQDGGLELFQRCPCGHGLGCRALRRKDRKEAQEGPEGPGPGHAPPHAPLLSAATRRADARLHVCQKN